MNETAREEHRGSSASVAEAWHAAPEVDDWLGETSDDDWSEPAETRRARRPAAHDDPWSGVDERASAPADSVPDARSADAVEARRKAVERRRVVAVLAAGAVLVSAVGAAVLVTRGGGGAPATSVSEPATTTPEPSTEQTETGAASPPATTTPTDTATTPTDTSEAPSTAPSTTTDDTTFALPEGVKLRFGEEADPAVVSSLQRALASAGYDPGPVDGTYGRQTVAAVVAFQQANGLSADGVVGAATAAALATALAAG